MPQLSEIVRGRDIGKTGSAAWQKFIWHACVDCGKERWVCFVKGNPDNFKCHKCANKYNGHDRWKNHVPSNKFYTYVQIEPDNFYYPMVKSNKNRLKGGVVKEHRLVMAKSLGRCLASWEFVHHKNGDRRDNRLENLELTTNGAHTIAHNKGYKDGYSKGLIDGRDKQIQELKTLIEEQTKQIKLCNGKLKN